MNNQQNRTIFVIVPSLGVGGREKIAINTVRSFERLGYRTILIFFQRRDTEYSFQGEYIYLDAPARNNPIGKAFAQIKRSVQLMRLRKQYKPQFVYSLGEAANRSNVLSGFTHWGKTIIAIHGFAEVHKGILNRFIFSKASCIVCIAQDMRYCLLRMYPKLRHVKVVENGYDLSTIERCDRAKLPSLCLVSMGRLTRVKGFDRLIKSMKMISQRCPGAKLTIIGAGEQEDELKALTAELGLQETVFFQGYLSDPFPVLQAQDIYALTSLEEGFPNALIEALHCGLPAVAVDCRTGPREILSAEYTPEPVVGIRHEKYGVLVENTTDGLEERFAQAVLQLWSDQKEMTYYRNVGPQRAHDFSLENYQEKLKKLLDEWNHEEA